MHLNFYELLAHTNTHFVNSTWDYLFPLTESCLLGTCNGSCNLHVHVVYLNHNFHLFIAPYLWIQISSQPQMPYINMGEDSDTEPHPGLLYYNFL